MKKIIFAVSLALMLLLSSCGGAPETPSQSGAQPDAAETKTPSQSGEQSIVAETKTPPAKALLDILGSDAYLLHYQGTLTLDGETMELDVTYVTNGDDTSIVNVMDDMTAHILVKDGVTYQIDDAAKTYYEIMETDGTENVLEAAQYEPTARGEAEVFGKMLPYDEYLDGEDVTRFYFDGDRLFAVTNENSDSRSLLKVLELTDKIPAGALDLPVGYQKGEMASFTDGEISEDLQKELDAMMEGMKDGEFTGDPPNGK